MEISAEQFSRIEKYLPRQRGNVSHKNLTVINAILYVAENGCKWRALPKRFGTWHTVHTRMNRWAKAGVLDKAVRKDAGRADCPHQDRSGEPGQHDREGPSRRHGCVKKTDRKPSANPAEDGATK